MEIRKALLAAVLLGAASFGSEAYAFSTYSARVNADGNVVLGSGVQSASQTSTGTYRVQFSRGLNNCVFVASVFAGIPGYAVVSNPSSGVVQVKTFSAQGTQASLGFSVIVSCAP